MDQQQPQQPPVFSPIQAMVGLLALAFLGAMGLIFIWNFHNLGLDIGNDNRSIACAKPAASLADIRDLLGCYRNTTAQGRAKDALRVALGQSCDRLAAFEIGGQVDLGDGRGVHPLILREVKAAYALAREIKRADIACTAIPRDPDDYTREVLIGLAAILAAFGILYTGARLIVPGLQVRFDRWLRD